MLRRIKNGYIMDLFNLTEKRHDAAQTLVVPYDATTDAVDAAYERRLSQRFELKNTDFSAFLRGNDALYDAHVRMRLPEDKQWLAQFRLLMTGHIDKSYAVLLYLFKHLRDKKYKSKMCRTMADELISDTKKLHCRYKVLNGICYYDIAAVWGQFAYCRLATEPNPIVSIAVLGSIFTLTMFGMPVVKHLMSEKIRDLAAKCCILYEILGPQDSEFYEFDQSIDNDLAAIDKMRQEMEEKYQKKYDALSEVIKKRADNQK